MVWITHTVHVKSAVFGSVRWLLLVDEALRTKVKNTDMSLTWMNS